MKEINFKYRGKKVLGAIVDGVEFKAMDFIPEGTTDYFNFKGILYVKRSKSAN